MRLIHHISRFLAVGCMLAMAPVAFAADDNVWTVSKSSGDVWLTGSGVQAASLKQEELLKPGDTVRTGRNGRVLLRRGEETMLISPNSVIGIPAEKTEGLSTTIVQQAGSILLEVEKRNIKHFEVETPYLAAVVKGTKFRVTINAGSTSVDVIRGQVEVADFRSGQVAQVMSGQHATTFTQDKVGLLLSGSGTFNPIEQGKPRAPSIERVPVPRAGISAPGSVTNGKASQYSSNDSRNQTRKTSEHVFHRGSDGSAARGSIRISSAIGEVKLNIHKVTHGLAQDRSFIHGGKRDGSSKETVWGSSNMGGSQSATSAGTPVYLSGSNAGSVSASTVGRNSNDNGSSIGSRSGTGNGANGNGSANGNGNNGYGSGSSAATTGNGNINSGSSNGKNNGGNNGNGNSGNGNTGNGNSGNGNSGNANSGNGNRNGGNGNGGNGNGTANGNNGNGRGRG